MRDFMVSIESLVYEHNVCFHNIPKLQLDSQGIHLRQRNGIIISKELQQLRRCYKVFVRNKVVDKCGTVIS